MLYSAGLSFLNVQKNQQICNVMSPQSEISSKHYPKYLSKYFILAQELSFWMSFTLSYKPQGSITCHILSLLPTELQWVWLNFSLTPGKLTHSETEIQRGSRAQVLKLKIFIYSYIYKTPCWLPENKCLLTGT